MKPLLKVVLVSVLVIACLNTVNAQTSRKEKKAAKIAAITGMIDSSNYIFLANFALPLRGGQKQLTSEYDVRVSKDTVIAYLPYYGRAYLADYNPTEGGIKFTSTEFKYSVKQVKNGAWEINIKPKDGNGTNWRDVQQMQFNISPDGYASLQVISTNRDPITFNGVIERRTEERH